MPDMSSKNTKTKFDLSNVIPLTQAAGVAGVTDRWMRFLVQSGAVKGMQVGRFWFVDKDSAESFKRHPSAGRPRKEKPI